MDTQPEQIPVTYCDHIEEVTAAAEPDHEITDEELVKLCRYIRRSTTFYNLFIIYDLGGAQIRTGG